MEETEPKEVPVVVAKTMWQWIIIYVVISAIVYGLIYYFVFLLKKGGYNSSGSKQLLKLL